MNKKFFRETKILLVSLTFMVGVVFVLCKYLLNKPFLLGNDQACQYNLFYMEWMNLLEGFFSGEGLPLYSWNLYLGTDFYSSMAYYCIGDIFLPFIYLLRNNLDLALIIETILCVYIAAFLMYAYLDKCGVKSIGVKTFISLVYAIGGMSMRFLGQYMWLRFFAFFPLIFIGLEDYFKKNKTGIFILAIFIEFLQSFYYMWPTSIFIFIFCIYYEIKYKRTNYILKDFLKLISRFIIGFLLSAFLMVPTIIYVLGNPRVGQSMTGGLLWDINTYLGLIINPAIYNQTLITSSVFPHEHGIYNLFIGFLPFVYAVAYAINKKNIHELMLSVVLLVMMFVKPIGSLMHGFSESSLRWVFIVEFYLLTLSAKGMDEECETKKFATAYGTVLLGIIIYLIINNSMLTEYTYQFIVFVFCAIINLLSFLIYKKKKNLGMLLTILMIFVIVMGQISYETKDAVKDVNSLDRNAISYLNNSGKDTFRIYADYDFFAPNSNLNLNQGISYNYMPVTTYNSLYDSTTSKLQELSGVTGYPNWILNFKNQSSWNALGVKYVVVSPNENYDENPNYQYVTNSNYNEIYENLNYRGFGYTMSELKYMDENSTVEDLDRYLLIDEDIDLTKYNNLECGELTVNWRTNNSLSGDISLNSDNILCIAIPNKEGWKVMVNGAETETISVNGGFMGIELSAGENHIELYYVPPGFKLGAVLTGIGTILFIGIMFLERKKNEI